MDSGRMVAVKLAQRLQHNDKLSTHLLREVRLASQLRHPNIAEVYDAGKKDQWHYIVSELVDGVSLADWLENNSPSVEDATKLCVSLATALEHAHRSGVVHRDLKPSNIVIGADGEPCIIDFGACKSTEDEMTMTMERYQRVLYHFQQAKQTGKNKQGPVVGTPQYMSPEQARGDAYFVDHRSDVYSLGTVFFELLTGKRAFRGSPEKVIRKVIHIEPTPPRRLNRRIPRDLETICLKSMSKDPAKRYASAREMAEDCQRALAGQPITARRDGWYRRAWRRIKGRVAMWRE
jgi:serine/threonine-protein kinase